MRVRHRAIAVAVLLLRDQVIAQVPAPSDSMSLLPALIATVSEAKPTGKNTAGDNSTLNNFLKQEGFAAVKLRQKDLDNQKMHKNQPKHLIVHVEVNRVSALLMVDTGTPTTNIAAIASNCRAKDFFSSHRPARIGF
jgi:hypothetical protein